MQLEKLEKMNEILYPVEQKVKKVNEFGDTMEQVTGGRPISSRVKSKSFSQTASGSRKLTRVMSARQTGFTSLNRKVDQDLTPIKSVGLLESHINAQPRSCVDMKLGQNMLKAHEALQTFVTK